MQISAVFLSLSSKTTAHATKGRYDSKQYHFCPHVVLQSTQNKSPLAWLSLPHLTLKFLLKDILSADLIVFWMYLIIKKQKTNKQTNKTTLTLFNHFYTLQLPLILELLADMIGS